MGSACLHGRKSLRFSSPLGGLKAAPGHGTVMAESDFGSKSGGGRNLVCRGRSIDGK